jgi:hypothetical protein
MKNRISIYFGKKDQDIINFIDPLTEHLDISDVIRQLLREAIQYRQGASLAPAPVTQKNVLNHSTNVLNQHTNVLNHNTKPKKVNLEDVVLEEIDDDDSEDDIFEKASKL